MEYIILTAIQLLLVVLSARIGLLVNIVRVVEYITLTAIQLLKVALSAETGQIVATIVGAVEYITIRAIQLLMTVPLFLTDLVHVVVQYITIQIAVLF